MDGLIDLPHYYLDTSGEILTEYLLMDLNGEVFERKQEIGFSDTVGLGRKLALVDRDGIIAEKAPRHQYILTPGDICLLDGAAEGIRQMNDLEMIVAVVTNQPMVSKGRVSLRVLYEINQELQRQLSLYSAHVDSVFFCPHPAPGEQKEAVDPMDLCKCRKPLPGMLTAAMRLYGCEKDATVMFGDFASDIFAARNAGVQGVWIATRHDEYEAMKEKICEEFPDVYERYQFPSLLSAAKELFGG